MLNIIKELQATDGKLEKQYILNKNKENEDLKALLYFVYNPMIVTGISSKKIAKNVGYEEVGISDFRELFSYLLENNTGSDKDIIVAKTFILNQQPSDRPFWKEVITKSLKVGCSAKTFNKVFGKHFIPEFNVMLAESYYDNMELVDGKEFTLTEKIDGCRIVSFKDEQGNVASFSRQGQPYIGLKEIEDEIRSLDIVNKAIDGELTIINRDEIPSDEQYKQTMKIVGKDGIKTGLKLIAFDILDRDEFLAQKCSNSYNKRRILLQDTFSKTTLIEPVKMLYSGSDVSQIPIILDEVTKNGAEGIMINLNDGFYDFKRTKKLLKCKKFLTADLRCVGVIEGSGENIGKLGAIAVEFLFKDNLYRCNCGSGLTKEEREIFWKNPEMILGKIVEIKYFEISKNDKGGFGLRFPVFKFIREGKDEISMF